MVKKNKTGKDEFSNKHSKNYDTEEMTTYYSDLPIFVVDSNPTTSECHMAKELSVPIFVLVTRNTCPHPEDYKRFTFCLPPLNEIHYFYVQDPNFIQLVKTELINKYTIRMKMKRKLEEESKTKKEEIVVENKLQSPTILENLLIDNNIEELFDEDDEYIDED